MRLGRVSLNTLAGRVVCRLLPGPRQHAMLVDPAWKMGGADLVWKRGVYYLHVTQSQEAPALPEEDGQYLGVDLGIVNLATDSEGQTFSGDAIRTARQRYQKRRQILQKVGAQSAKRRLKQLSGREHRFQRDTNHKISKALVQKATQSRKALAIEDLTGIRARTTVRREQRNARHA